MNSKFRRGYSFEITQDLSMRPLLTSSIFTLTALKQGVKDLGQETFPSTQGTLNELR